MPGSTKQDWHVAILQGGKSGSESKNIPSTPCLYKMPFPLPLS